MLTHVTVLSIKYGSTMLPNLCGSLVYSSLIRPPSPPQATTLTSPHATACTVQCVLPLVYSSLTRPPSPPQTTTLTSHHSNVCTVQCALEFCTGFTAHAYPTRSCTLFPSSPYPRKSYPCRKKFQHSTFTTMQNYATENRYVD